MRTRMSWDWVDCYPIFVYTTFVDHFEFDVSVRIRPIGNQNGEERQLLAVYRQSGVASKDGVVSIAMEKARIELGVPANWKELLMKGANLDPEVCQYCGAFADTKEEITHFGTCDPTAVYEYNEE